MKRPTQLLGSSQDLYEKILSCVRKSVTLPCQVYIPGLDFKIRLIKRDKHFSPVVAALRLWEPAVTRTLVRLVKPGDVVFDVGAYLGWYTIIASKLVSNGAVFSFEPNPLVFNVLKENVELNHLQNVKLFNVALSDHTGSDILSFSSSNLLSAIVSVKKGSNNLRNFPVDLMTLEKVANSNTVGSIRLLKIDVEGHEPSVLKGAIKLIRQGRIRNIIIEFNLQSWEREKPLFKELLDLYYCTVLTDEHPLKPQILRKSFSELPSYCYLLFQEK